MNAIDAKRGLTNDHHGPHEWVCKGYLAALDGPEVKALVEALERCEKFDTSTEPSYGADVRGNSPGAGKRFLRPRDYARIAIQAFRKAVGK